MNSAVKIMQEVCDELQIKLYADMPLFSAAPEFDFIVYNISKTAQNYENDIHTEIINDITLDYFLQNNDEKCVEELIIRLCEKDFVFGSSDKLSKELAEPCKFRYTLNFIYI